MLSTKTSIPLTAACQPHQPIFTCAPRSHSLAPSSRCHSHPITSLHHISSNRNQTCTHSSSPTTTQQPTTNSTPHTWPAFCNIASGEWDGVTATFDRDGEPQELPEYYVPAAYRDWDVQIHDWVSQCSMLSDDAGLRYTLRRLMPTVGCEADAIAFNEEQPSGVLFTPGSVVINAQGGYSVPPMDLSSPDVHQAQAEHCFNLGTDNKGKEQRLRVVHLLKRMGADRVWKIMGIELHKERKDGPFNGRRELAGCGGNMDLFATTEALDVNSGVMTGEWKVSNSDTCSVAFNGVNKELVSIQAGIPWTLNMDGLSVLGLPLNSWSASKVEGEDVDLYYGVVSEDGKLMKVARQEIRQGVLVEAMLMTLTR